MVGGGAARQVNVRALLPYFHLKATPAQAGPSRTAPGPGLNLHMKVVAERKKKESWRWKSCTRGLMGLCGRSR